MDPNACLAEIRELLGDTRHLDPDVANDRLRELVQALDEWLSNGGFLPSDWDGPREWSVLASPAEHVDPDDDNPDDPDDFIRDTCGCGHEIVLTPDGWQHESAPYFWGDDHDAEPS